MDRYLGIADVADVLNLNCLTVRKLITTGQLKASRVCGKYRVWTRDIQQFMKKQSVTRKGRKR